jgi:hypothetical protein
MRLRSRTNDLIQANNRPTDDELLNYRRLLTLSLFVARVAAHDADHTSAAHDLALVANTADAGTDFHGNTHSTKRNATGERQTRRRQAGGSFFSDWWKTIEYTGAGPGSTRAPGMEFASQIWAESHAFSGTGRLREIAAGQAGLLTGRQSGQLGD